MPETCNICVENIDRSNKKIICFRCNFECCKTCFTRYVQEPEHYLTCMSCKGTFTRTAIYENLAYRELFLPCQ